MNASEIRQKFLEYQQKLGHQIIAPAKLVLENDPTTLFTGSGMQPLLPFLLGEPHPAGKRLADSQPCLRLQDIEDVGDPRHTTVFEMLGNWSLGDYFKNQQIPAFFKFLTEEVGLDPHKIYVTCFIGSEKYGIPKDTEAAEIWQQVFREAGVDARIAEIGSATEGAKRGIKEGEHIFFYDDHENWWSRGGGVETTPIGDPCGPDSEVFYDFGEDKQDVAMFGKSHPASDGARFMEIGNQVFMQYKRNEDGSFSELKHKNIDFGGGLERIAAAAIGSFDVFETSILKPLITKIEEISQKNYKEYTADMRIIADHLRGAYLLSAQGLTPSNRKQGYALRRLIRRAILRALNLGIDQDFLPQIIPLIEMNYRDLSDEILNTRKDALAVLIREEQVFRRTLVRGLKELHKLKEAGLSGKELFMLQDTYGFPLELSVEEAKREKIELSPDWQSEFNQCLAAQRERSKTASKGMFKGGLEDHSEMSTKYHTATHLLLAALQKLINPKIGQAGSNITSERLRFDFNLDRKLTPEETKALEEQVNQWISEDYPVKFAEYEKDYARDTLHAHGQFWEKYPNIVKVYTIGDFEHPISRELCGGPHVKHTGQLGKFKIKKEESSASGIRRIKAVLEN
ncbi:MAG: alanine--tRNA ligase [Candidatus Nanosyncoccus sp.]